MTILYRNKFDKGRSPLNSLREIFTFLDCDLLLLTDNIQVNLPNSSLISIKYLCHFLQRWSLRLRIEKVDSPQFEEKPNVVDNVVFPPDGGERNWIDVIVEEESGVDAEKHDCETLCAEVVRTDFNGISDEKTRPCDRIGELIKNEHGDDCIPCCLDLSLVIKCGANGHCRLR